MPDQKDDEAPKTDDNGEKEAESKEEQTEEEPAEIETLSIASPAQPAAPPAKVKGRVLFLYTCPSSSPIKYRMVYSSGVRGMQQDAADKAGIEISGKVDRLPHLPMPMLMRFN